MLVFIGLWANIDNIFEVITEKYISGKNAILILGIAYIFEMATGASNNIIAVSKHYKYLTWFVAGMLVLAVVSNLIFIPLYQVTGVALATAITTIGFTLLKVGFIYKKFGIQPFNMKFLYVTLIGSFVYGTSIFIPAFDNYIFDIIIRSAFISIFYFVVLFLTRVSADLNEGVRNIIKKLPKF
ncbi:MAG: hypothetical protein HC831_13905 [Chloroflexia bacterium]|nr:hypothetical protein [Chloroflexia bacterium]